MTQQGADTSYTTTSGDSARTLALVNPRSERDFFSQMCDDVIDRGMVIINLLDRAATAHQADIRSEAGLGLTASFSTERRSVRRF